ncbi:hypothetical protein [Nitrobacter sp. JJSN]|uniref:hypothetical protein n=1 Tax=Nitrobacter sp. JJSN TaxID=3453033 RepID=UPI003F76FE50
MRKIADERARRQTARPSSEVAEVANRPKKRPGKRLRSSITMRTVNRPMPLLV